MKPVPLIWSKHPKLQRPTQSPTSGNAAMVDCSYITDVPSCFVIDQWEITDEHISKPFPGVAAPIAMGQDDLIGVV